jgi:hypothetical protein
MELKMLSTNFFDRFTADPHEIDQRIRKPISLSEFAALALALIFPIAVMLISSVELGGQQAYDFQLYLNTAKDDFSGFYYAYWLLPLWKFLDLLPLWLTYVVWTSVSVACIFFASRIFGSNTVLILFCYQTLQVLYMGQYSGILVGGLALLWWGVTHKHWNIAGIGLIIAASKYHTGLIPAMILLYYSHASWRERLKVFYIPVVIGIISLMLYQFWPLHVLENYRANPANDWGSVAPWKYIGPIVLLVWIPSFLLKLNRNEKILLLFATLPLGMPYFQAADLLILYVLPIGFLPMLSYIGFFRPFIGYAVDNILIIIPLFIYLKIVVPAFMRSLKNYCAPQVAPDE